MCTKAFTTDNVDDSSVFYCTSVLHSIFSSLARGHEREHVLNMRDFPQVKLNSEINARLLLLNEHGDLEFLLNNFCIKLSAKKMKVNVASMVTYLFIVFFKTVLGRKHSGKV